MRNKSLSQDYVIRAGHRLKAIQVLYDLQSWADVVRESQEAIELALKGLLRAINIEPPRVHDVSAILLEHRDNLPRALKAHVEKFAAVSRTLRRDRELAFYGSEDLTPSEFYQEADAKEAFAQATWLVGEIADVLKPT